MNTIRVQSFPQLSRFASVGLLAICSMLPAQQAQHYKQTKTDAAGARVDSTSSSGSTTRAAASTSPKRRHAIDADEAYKNNCMRCHTELPQYSPRMSKTILMHMRVDGNIPGDEADAILEYLRGQTDVCSAGTDFYIPQGGPRGNDL